MSEEIKFTLLQNLLLNMACGLLPENLSVDEVKLLENEFGKDWFEYLGYLELDYKKPNFINTENWQNGIASVLKTEG